MERNKCFLVFLFFFSYVRPGEPALSKAALQQTQNMMKNLCKRSSGVQQDALNKLKTGVFLEDQKLKCYIHCCLGMMKTMKKDKITVPEATKQIESLLPDDMKKVALAQLNACKDADGADGCEKAFNFVKCCQDLDPGHLLIPT